MRFCYSVFGLALSANRRIPGLHESSSPFDLADVRIDLDSIPKAPNAGFEPSDTVVFTSSILLNSGEPLLRIWQMAEGLFRLEYHDGTTFWLDRAGNRVWVRWRDGSTLEDAATYLLGPVLGFLLRLRGVTCLHASAVAMGKYAVAFAGVEGAGKSTTAAALAKRGHPVISDDIVALTVRASEFLVQPAYPYLCLWPDSVGMIYGASKSLPAFSANFDKRQLALTENSLRFESRPVPLKAIYLLGERKVEDRAPYLETPERAESLFSLIADTYATKLLDTQMRAREFEVLGSLLAHVPVLRLHPHRDGARLDRLCELIEQSFAERLGIAAPASSAAV